MKTSYHFRDLSNGMVEAWKYSFSDVEDVEISRGDIFDGTSADAIVSPANSFGFMNGGIDGVYTARFGPGLQERLQEILRSSHDGELPVGQAQVVRISKDDDFSYLVSAPTMRVPGDVSMTPNAYLAFRAVIRVVKNHNALVAALESQGVDTQGFKRIATVLCPGLGTAVGSMPFDKCAAQMRAAYNASYLGEIQVMEDLPMAASYDRKLRGLI